MEFIRYPLAVVGPKGERVIVPAEPKVLLLLHGTAGPTILSELWDRRFCMVGLDMRNTGGDHMDIHS